MESDTTRRLEEPVLRHARKDVTTLRQDWTVRQALDTIRREGIGEKIIYFYVTDAADRLAGVLPTRRLLTAELDRPLAEIMLARVIAIPQTATLLEACELFVMHQYLAFPIIDEERRVVGLIDVGVFTEEVLKLAPGEPPDHVFEALGFHLAQVRDATPGRAFRFRFPWLLATLASGTMCALLAGRFEMTLAKALVLTFFLPLVLAMAESVSIQSMTMALQALRSMQPSWRWYLSVLRREASTGLFLGAVCGAVVAAIVWFWRGTGMAALILSLTILLSLGGACVIGLSIPALLHTFKLDPKIAAGPVTLAFTDVLAILTYLLLAAWLL